MFRKNPISEGSLIFLRENHPHRWLHLVFVLIAMSVVLVFLWRGYSIQKLSTIYTMAAIVLPIYWYFQFRMMQSASKLTYYDWQSEIPEAQVGTISSWQVRYGKVRAVLTHHRLFIVLISMVLISLSLMNAGYLLFESRVNWNSMVQVESTRGILEYVGPPPTGYIPSWRISWAASDYLRPFVHETPQFTSVSLISLAMIALTITNSILSISIGIVRPSKAVVSRLMIIGIAALVFTVLFNLRNSPVLYCARFRMMSPPEYCSGTMLLWARLMDSFQAITLAFIDGGMAMASGLNTCGGYVFRITGYQGRHLLAVMVTIFSQIGLSYLLLIRASTSFKKKT